MTHRFIHALYWIAAIFAALFLFMGSCGVAAAQTTITDTLQTPQGQPFEGKVIITAPRQMTHAGNTYVGWERTWNVTAGTFSATLVPNDAATPAGTSYRVQYIPKQGTAWTETWVVPTSGSALKVHQVRVITVPTPSLLVQLQQISTAGAQLGYCLKVTSVDPVVITWAPCGGSSGPSGLTWSQLTSFTWSQLNSTTWSQLQ